MNNIVVYESKYGSTERYAKFAGLMPQRPKRLFSAGAKDGTIDRHASAWQATRRRLLF